MSNQITILNWFLRQYRVINIPKYKTTIDYNQTIEAMLKTLHYDSISNNITKVTSPSHDQIGLIQVNIFLLKFNHEISCPDAIAEMRETFGFRPATIRELLSIPASNKEQIIAAGSTWTDLKGAIRMPYLYGSAGSRSLRLGWFSASQSSNWRFAAVSE